MAVCIHFLFAVWLVDADYLTEFVLLAVSLVLLSSYNAGLYTVSKFVGDHLGTKSYGFNFGVTIFATGVFNTVFSNMAGAIYDRYATGANTTCYGIVCYRYTFIVTSFAAFLSAGLAVVLSRRTKRPQQWF